MTYYHMTAAIYVYTMHQIQTSISCAQFIAPALRKLSGQWEHVLAMKIMSKDGMDSLRVHFGKGGEVGL